MVRAALRCVDGLHSQVEATMAGVEGGVETMAGVEGGEATTTMVVVIETGDTGTVSVGVSFFLGSGGWGKLV